MVPRRRVLLPRSGVVAVVIIIGLVLASCSSGDPASDEVSGGEAASTADQLEEARRVTDCESIAAVEGQDGAATATGGARCPENTIPSGPGLPDITVGPGLPDRYGDDDALDVLWDACEAGSGQACDSLFLEAPGGSAYEAFGYECGNRPAVLVCSDLDG